MHTGYALKVSYGPRSKKQTKIRLLSKANQKTKRFKGKLCGTKRKHSYRMKYKLISMGRKGVVYVAMSYNCFYISLLDNSTNYSSDEAYALGSH